MEKKNIIVIIFVLILALVWSNCKKCDINTLPIVNIGLDTTITCGDTLVLDAGTGFASYVWNDTLSFNQKLKVIETGTYWVKVTDKYNNTTTDTIEVNVTKKFVFFEYSIQTPCDYSIKYSQGDDSFGFTLKSEKQSIALGYEIQMAIPLDTLKTLTEIFKKTFDHYPEYLREYNFYKIVLNPNGEEIGACYTIKSNKHISGLFFVKEKDYFVELTTIYSAKNAEDELFQILSTIKKISE